MKTEKHKNENKARGATFLDKPIGRPTEAEKVCEKNYVITNTGI